MNDLERFFNLQQSVRILESIESAAWSIAVLLLIIGVKLLVSMLRGRGQRAEPDWNEIVEKACEAARTWPDRLSKPRQRERLEIPVGAGPCTGPV